MVKLRKGKIMKIGVIGPESSCNSVKESLQQIDSELEVSCYIRERVSRCGEVVEACEGECDAILFTGCAVEDFVTGSYEIKKPYTSVERSSVSVAGAFLKMQKQDMELDAFSIDVVENQVITDLLDAVQILARNIYSCSMQPGVDEQEYVDWHIRLQEEGKTNVALTSFVWVYNTLVEQGYQAIYLRGTRETVRRALERLKSKYALTQAEYSRIAVEVLKLTNYECHVENYYASMIGKAEMEKEIVRYVQSIQGTIFPFGKREYVVFSNAGVIENVQNYRRIQKLQQTVKKTGIELDVGIGMGLTVYKADMNARKALEQSVRRKKQELFLVDEKDVLLGPLDTERQLRYELISSDPKIREIAAKTGLSEHSVLKVIAIAQARKSFIFDAHELAECLEVTVRSARRIMNKIMDSGYGKLHAKEMAVSGGRPKALIEILFQ